MLIGVLKSLENGTVPFKAHLHYIRRLTELSCTSGSLSKFLFDHHARKTYNDPAKRIDIRVSSTAVKLNSSTTIFQRRGFAA
jgi:hypothetical protein